MKWTPVLAGATARDHSTLFPHYFDAQNMLFRIENSLRFLVFVVLKDALGQTWRGAQIPAPDGAGGTTIDAKASQRIRQSQALGHVGLQVSCPMLHLTTGELAGLILSDAYWKHFAPYFVAKREVVKLKFDEITQVRNALAHCRPLREEDVDLVAVNSRHLFPKVTAALSELFSTKSPVPTNTPAAWYKSLGNVVIQPLTAELSTCMTSAWIELRLRFVFPVSYEPLSKTFQRWTAYAVCIPAILDLMRSASGACVILSERRAYLSGSPVPPSELVKTAVLVFGARRLAELHAEIRNEVVTLASEVQRQVLALQTDPLSAQPLVRLLRGYCQLNDQGLWYFEGNNPVDAVQDASPPEFLGVEGTFPASEFTEAASTFPWFPTHICKDEIPF